MNTWNAPDDRNLNTSCSSTYLLILGGVIGCMNVVKLWVKHTLTDKIVHKFVYNVWKIWTVPSTFYASNHAFLLYQLLQLLSGTQIPYIKLKKYSSFGIEGLRPPDALRVLRPSTSVGPSPNLPLCQILNTLPDPSLVRDRNWPDNSTISSVWLTWLTWFAPSCLNNNAWKTSYNFGIKYLCIVLYDVMRCEISKRVGSTYLSVEHRNQRRLKTSVVLGCCPSVFYGSEGWLQPTHRDTDCLEWSRSCQSPMS